MEYMKNTSYFFVPFKYEKYERFKDLTRMLDESDSGIWCMMRSFI